MYYTQRMPTLISWQMEVPAYQLAGQPESQQVLTNMNRVAGAAEAFGTTAAILPKLANDQREAAIRQVFAGLAAERTKWLASLSSGETNARAMLVEMRQTFNQATEMANAVNGAVKSLDAFVRSVTPTNSKPENVSTNDKPFDVLDYGRAASQVGEAAKELHELLGSLDQSTPQVARLSQQASADAERVVQRAFRLGVLLIVILLAGSVVAGLTYRALANRLTRDRRQT